MQAHRSAVHRFRSLAWLAPLLALGAAGAAGADVRPISLNQGYLGPYAAFGGTTQKATKVDISRSAEGFMVGVRGSILGSIFFNSANDLFQVGEMEIVNVGLDNVTSPANKDDGIGLDARYGYGLQGNAKVGGGFLVGASWSNIFDRTTGRQGNAQTYSEQAKSFTQVYEAQVGYENLGLDARLGNHGFLSFALRYCKNDTPLGTFYQFQFDRFDRDLDSFTTNTSNEIKLLIGLTFL